MNPQQATELMEQINAYGDARATGNKHLIQFAATALQQCIQGLTSAPPVPQTPGNQPPVSSHQSDSAI